jgi:hypothetical protein
MSEGGSRGAYLGTILSKNPSKKRPDRKGLFLSVQLEK